MWIEVLKIIVWPLAIIILAALFRNPLAMQIARRGMNDFRLIYKDDGSHFMPEDTLSLHRDYTEKLLSWFEEELSGPRVVISHHAPVVNPNTQYVNTPLMPAFNSLDMIEIIERHQPDLWVYGHTHECDDQKIGKTRIISNQLGYSNPVGFELRASSKNSIPPIMPPKMIC